MEPTPERIDIPLVWIGIEDAPVLLVNQFLGQIEQDEIFLILGQMTPPVLVGTPQQVFEQARNVGYVPVKTVARLGFTRSRLVELIDVLRTTLRNYDQAHPQQRQEGRGRR